MRSISFRNSIYVDPESLDEPSPEDPEIQAQYQKIYEELQAHPEVDDINFRDIWATEYELKQLAEVLKPHANLTYLDFKYNRLDGSSMKYLKKIIKEHPLLKYISLDNNNIDDEGLQILLEDEDPGYRERIKKITFRFYDNQITEKGVEFAFDKLSQESLLSALSFNKVSEKAEQRLRILIKASNKSIEPKTEAPNALSLEETALEKKNKILESEAVSSPIMYSNGLKNKENSDENIISPESKNLYKP